MPSRCSVCPIHNPNFDGNQWTCRVIEGDGLQPARVVFVGAGPGASEQKTGRPYSGKAGDELNITYLSLAGLSRDEVFVTNATTCWDGSDRIPAEKRVKECALNHLPLTLDRCNPDVVVLMGGVTQTIADSTYRLDMVHGIPQYGTLLGGRWEGWIVPMYEPALGMRDTRFMNFLLEDFRRLGEWLNGEWEPPQTTEIETDYRLIHTVEEVNQYLLVPLIFPEHPHELALDTESHGPKTFSAQISIEPHTGRMILAEDTAALARVGELIGQYDLTTIMHNASHDLDDAERLGIEIGQCRDTMQEAFQQCSLPQGLKSLVYRLFGYRMKSWDETVWPASIQAMTLWMSQAILIAQTNLTDIQVEEMKTRVCTGCRHKAHTGKRCGSKAGEWKGVKGGCSCADTVKASNKKYAEKAGAVEAVLMHCLSHTMNTYEAEKPYDPWVKLKEMKEVGLRGKVPEKWEFEWLEQELGPVPILGIGNVEIGEAVTYGCSDSDWTGQAAAELEVRRGDPRWTVDQRDRDR